MSLGLQILVYAVGGLVALAVGTALLKSRRPIRGLLSSGAQGICALAAVNVAGAFTGVSLGLSLLSGLCCVVLGIPGVVALLVLKVIFNV
ncbi:MAG: transcriptional regulator [Clostridiales bacterium]|nr:transcriptional regulator [Clostridiales bacterium]